MKYDAHTGKSDADLATFVDWLRSEAVSALQRSHGDREGVNTAMFLFANRAYEAHLPESRIWKIAGEAIGRASYSVKDAESALDILEEHAGVAAQVYEDG